MSHLSSRLSVFCCIVSVFLLVFLNGCTEESNVENTVTVHLSSEKSEYAPYEIVTIAGSGIPSGEGVGKAAVGGMEVLVSGDGNAISFVLPDLPNGSYDFSYVVNNNNYIAPIQVAALQDIKGADEYYGEIESRVLGSMDQLNAQLAALEGNPDLSQEYANLKKDIIRNRERFDEYSAAYKRLSAAEKEEFAKVIAANKSFLETYDDNSAALRESTARLRTAASVQDYEKEVEISAAAFVKLVIFTGFHVSAMVVTGKMIAKPLGWVSVGGAVALGLVFTSYCIHVDETITAAGILINSALKPFEFLPEKIKEQYDSGKEKIADIQAKYRSLMASDETDGSGGILTTIVKSYTEFMAGHNSFMDKLPSILKPTYIMNPLKTSFTSAARSVRNKYIKVTGLNNPNVELEQLNQEDGSIKLKVTNNTFSDQDFSYEVHYTHMGFNNSLKKTVNAKVLALVDSIPIYTASAIGSYTVDYSAEPGNTTGIKLYCELKADNIAKYTIYNSPSWPDGHTWELGWIVRKANNRYYILTAWTNPPFLIHEAQPLTYPVTGFVYRHAYTK